MTEDEHRSAAKEAFNRTWELIEADRDDAADRMMIGAALASWYHWRQVGDAKNHSVSDWQVSRVFALIGDPLNAAVHAAESLRIAEEADLPAFYVAYAHEAAGRAAALAGLGPTTEKHIAAARELLDSMDAEERALIEADLATI